MKNIHLIPTDKPSRLWINTITGKLVLDEEPNTLHSQNIYITSDEKIKEGDWFLHPFNTLHKAGGNLIDKDFRKIILTTDQDLIKEGVQAIDDNFLEWFVKNPNCEYVEVKSKVTKDGVWTDLKGYVELPTIHSISYKIIIPKKEPKIDYSYFIKQKEEEFKNFLKKREATPEEVAEYLGFVNGVKWQQEQDKKKYTEEETEELITEAIKRTAQYCNINKLYGDTIEQFSKEWFNENKKK